MAIFTGTGGPDTADSTAGALIGFTGGTVVELQDAIGDSFFGDAGADLVVAGAGGDIITGGLGGDTLRGGVGDDTFVYTSADEIGADIIDGGEGVDKLRIDFAGVADFTGATIASTGTSSIEYVALNGAGHDVRLNASQVNVGNRADPSAGQLTIEGDTGVDIVTFNGAVDFSLVSANLINWDNSFDRIAINGTSGADYIVGSAKSDIIHGGVGSDLMGGGDGDDVFLYLSSAEIDKDEVYAGNGVDTFRLSFTGLADFTKALIFLPQIERIELFGAGHDVRFDTQRLYQGGNSAVVASVTIQGDAAGADTITFTNGTRSLAGFQFENWDESVDRVIINGNETFGDGTMIVASRVADTINALNGDDTVMAGAGADIVNGGVGNDTLIGGAGDDVMDGGAGADFAEYTEKTAGVVVFLDGANDAVVAVGGVNEDVLRNIENVRGGSAADSLVGDGADNTLVGLVGADFLFSNGFNPDGSMKAGAGNDSLDGGVGDDGLFGGDGNDTLSGGVNGNDSLSGGGGNDTLLGGVGADFLFGGSFAPDGSRSPNSGNDTVNAGSDNDALYGFDGLDTLNGENGDDYVEGGEGKDTINGGAGSDYLQGQADNDTINGGAGFDYMYGGAGADVFVFRKRDSADWILDFSAGDSDMLKIEGFGYANFAAIPLVDMSTPGNPAVQLTVSGPGGVDQLTIFGVTLAQLNATNVLAA